MLGNEVEKRVDLVFVVSTFPDGWFSEGHIVNQLWSKATVRRRVVPVHEEMVALRPPRGGY